MKFVSITLILGAAIQLCGQELRIEVKTTDRGEKRTYYRDGTRIMFEEYFDIGSEETGRRYFDQTVWIDEKPIISVSTFLVSPRITFLGSDGIDITTFPEEKIVLVETEGKKEGFSIREDGTFVPFDAEKYREWCVVKQITIEPDQTKTENK